ncbi:hypothetical protein BDW42DRAFT_85625 [Aspergillus taichungensis]|uniref:Uncharacterized protein n=1 Tax=Aspergillus taichungensis TaxID=482145 RepID=A0A2J5HXB7_9EURO|nr:hypothetical protein BDW42DRAFT_85625 [Aspergillus taichungensis]
MECFRQIARLVKSPFQRDSHRPLEIGPPTNFRKEEKPTFFSDAEDDAATLHSHGSMTEKDEKDSMIKELEREPSTTAKLRSRVRRLSVRVAHQLPDHDDGPHQ